MALMHPPKSKYVYAVSKFRDEIFVGTYDDGTHYYNIVSIHASGPKTSNPIRVVARAATLENAQALVDALNKYAV